MSYTAALAALAALGLTWDDLHWFRVDLLAELARSTAGLLAKMGDAP